MNLPSAKIPGLFVPIMNSPPRTKTMPDLVDTVSAVGWTGGFAMHTFSLKNICPTVNLQALRTCELYITREPSESGMVDFKRVSRLFEQPQSP